MAKSELRFSNKIDRRHVYSQMGAIFLCFVLVIMFFFVISRSLSNRDCLEKGWTIQFNSDVHYDVSLKRFRFPYVNEGDYVIMTYTVQESDLRDYADPMIRFASSYSVVDVFLNYDHVYSYGHEKQHQGKNVGMGGHLAPISGYKAGDKIRIFFKVVEPWAFNEIQPVYLSDGRENPWKVFFNRPLIVAENFFLIFFALVLCVASVVRMTFRKEIWSFLLIAMILFWTTIMMLYHNGVILLVSDVFPLNSYIHYFSGCSVYLTTTLLFIGSLKGKERKRERHNLIGFYSFYVVFILVSLILDLTSVLHIGKVRMVLLYLTMPEMGYITWIVFANMNRRKGQNRIMSIGYLVMSFFFLFGMLRYMTVPFYIPSSVYNSATTLGTGALLFSLLGIIDRLLVNDKNEYIEEMRETYEKPEDADYLTGVFTEKKYKERITQLEKEHDHDFCVLLLNYVGEFKDDRVLKFATLISRVFGYYGSVCRVKSSLFAIVAPDISEMKIQQLLNSFMQNVIYENNNYKGDQDGRISYTFGYAFRNEGIETSQILDEVLRRMKRPSRQTIVNGLLVSIPDFSSLSRL